MEGKRTAWTLAPLTAAILLMVFIATAPVAAANDSAGTGVISGKVFFDANGDGQIAPNGAEPGIPSVTVQLLDANATLTTTTDANGAYTFSGLAAGNYTVTVQPPAAYVTTTATSKPVAVGSSLTPDVHFGLAYPISIWGTVCQDSNGDGQCALPTAEPRIVGATVQVFNDANRNGLIDPGEAILASQTSDAKGLYLLTNLQPGPRILLVRLPGGAESNSAPLSLESGEAGATTVIQNFAIGRAGLEGVIFNDTNGDEFPDAGEAPVRSAVVQLMAAAGGRAVSPLTVIATTTTGIDGKYVFANLLVAAYQVRVAAPVPMGWLASSDPSSMIPALQANVTTTLNIGYFDPAAAPPMSVADWKRELRQAGQWAYTAAEQDSFIAAGETASRAFAETMTLRDALLMGRAADVSVEKWRAQKELAALWLNIVSLRLRPDTPVNLGPLSTATTVRQARDEAEALVLSSTAAFASDAAVTTGGKNGASAASVTPLDQTADYSRARAIAQALNTGQGVGAMLTGASAVIDAIYDGSQVAPRLKLGGDIVKVKTGSVLTLRKWSVGAYPADANTLMAQIRLRVKSFNQGSVLNVVQVFPDGRRVTLGTLRLTVQNKDVNRVYLLNLLRITTIAELVNTNIVLTVRDLDGGKPASVKVDSAEIIFRY